MNHGIAAEGPPSEVFVHPAMERIFGILPDVSRLQSRAKETEAQEGEGEWN